LFHGHGFVYEIAIGSAEMEVNWFEMGEMPTWRSDCHSRAQKWVRAHSFVVEHPRRESRNRREVFLPMARVDIVVELGEQKNRRLTGRVDFFFGEVCQR
jgi:hypothetical protein